MRKFTFKSLLVTAALCLTTSAWAEDKTYSEIYSNNFAEASDVTIWTSGNTGRYTVNHITRTEVPMDKAVAIKPVSNGNNGTAITCSVLNTLTDYLTSDDYKIEFEMNFSINDNQMAYYQIYDNNNTEIVGIYQLAKDNKEASIRLSAGGTNTGGTELGTLTVFSKHAQPNTYNKFVITGNATEGTNLTITPAGGESVTYNLSKSLVYIGKMVHNTKRYYNYMVFDNLVVSKAVKAGYVAAPVIEISKVNEVKRNVDITCVTDNAVIYYSTDGGAIWSKYTSEIEISATTTIQAKATLNTADFTDLKDEDFSELSTLEVVAGETISLNGVSITRTGENTYSLSCDQTNVLCSPVPTIHYALNGVEQGTYVSELSNASTSVTIDGYGTITAWATAGGYTDSDTTPFNAVKSYQSSAIWTVNLTEYGNNNSETGVLYSSEKTEVVGEVNYSAPINGSSDVLNENFYMMNDGGWLLRNSGRALKAQTGVGGFMFKGVKKGQLVIVNYSKEGTKGGFSVTSGSATEFTNFGGNITFEVTEDCDLVLRVAVGTTTYTVGVYKKIETVSITSAGYATFSSTYAVDFSESGLAAYTAKVNDGNKTITLTKIADGIVPANTGVVLKGAAGEYTGTITTTDATVDNDLIANNAEITSDGNIYVLNNGTNGIGFYPLAEGKTLAAGKAYLQLASGAKGYSFVWNDGETTGIEENYEFGTMNSDAATFDLSGRKVANPAKGLYIKNGKKFIVK